MGNHTCLDIVKSSEELSTTGSKSIKQISSQIDRQDQDQVDASLFQQEIKFIFWFQNNQDDILLGALFDKDLSKNTYKFFYKKQVNQYGGYSRDGLTKFYDKFIPIQEVREVQSKFTLNELLTLYQAVDDPESLLKQIFAKEQSSEEQNIKFEKNESYQKINAIGKKSSEYTNCYQNYFNKNQLLFESQGQTVYSYNWDRKQIQQENYQSIYQYAIILKNPLKDKSEIIQRCKKYNSSSEFLKSEKE